VSSQATTTILVCEDDPSVRLLLRLAIERRGHRVVEAGDGEAGILLARSVEPDLIVVDMRLPDRSGIDVVRTLRNEPALAATPILMATGSAQPSDRLAAEDAGVDAFVYKPFDISGLVHEIERMLEKSASHSSALPLHRLH
jgi:DNA-binding response OmpR family regulator